MKTSYTRIVLRSSASMSARITYPHLRKGPSTIQGTGLFATKPIPKGSRIGEYRGPTAKRDGKYVMWMLQDDGTWIARSGRNILRYANHSKTPNAEVREFEFFAIQDISEGEEITFDYNGDHDPDPEDPPEDRLK